ncbi:MAG: phosphate ABC transporter, permease protein PstA, partial [Bifidobacterium crudilactis]|nr:phosphate ABC transporter, permease protein PstA [Bifidobacterium crudilactis]
CLPGIRMERAWAAALMLILIVLVLNLIGRRVAKVLAVKTQD